MRSLNVEGLEHRELVNRLGTERFSWSASLSELLAFKDFSIHHEILLPGRRASSPHTHSHREEMIFILKGTPTAVFRGQPIELQPGDFIGFPPGSENVHFVENRSEQDASFLLIASKSEQDLVTYERDIFQSS
ncbi:MAG: hypothetical protein RJB38_2394 [Pseudomonadota bacterium]|jgi:uncharacterized cupin superfamily protein